MFIITKKVRRGKLAACTLLLALTVFAAGSGAFLARDIQQAVTVAATTAQADPTGIRTNEDRVAYLEKLGWLPAKEPAAIEDVRIPETFDDSYDDYLAVQKEMGFDLTPYAGETVKRYTYQIKNYPGLQQNIWASLLICKRTVIGGEVFCSQGDGFTQSLKYPMAEK